MKKLISAILCIAMLFSLTSAVCAKETYAAEEAWYNGSPYYIMVNRKMCTVTVFGLNDEGTHYTKPVKAMICSTGKPGEETPLGTYWIDSYKYRWLSMIDGSYGQYACSFYGNYLFHSICYYDSEPDQMMTNEYNDLGTNVSLGCVRLQTVDAKWIYDNCPGGTTVTIYESDNPGPLGRPEKKVSYITEEMANGWDPTDPSEKNPWKNIKPESITLNKSELSLNAGEADVLTASVLPEATSSLYGAVRWTSSDTSVATVSGGRVVAMGEGTAVITAECDSVSASCTVTVTGELMPFTDAVPGEWYYNYVKSAVGYGLFNGVSETTFEPDTTMNRAMLAQVLYNIAKDGDDSGLTESPFTDVTEDDWFYPAVMWAYENGIVDGMGDGLYMPYSPVSREQLATMLFRYYVNYLGKLPDLFGDVTEFSDHAEISEYAYEAVRWSYGNGIITGMTDTTLCMRAGATRAQAATMLVRWYETFAEMIVQDFTT